MWCLRMAAHQRCHSADWSGQGSEERTVIPQGVRDGEDRANAVAARWEWSVRCPPGPPGMCRHLPGEFRSREWIIDSKAVLAPTACTVGLMAGDKRSSRVQD
ncbi:hypothetical protein Afil01_17780 [Actinorhabdospora filicis]|uniref:Uncharacterized protein n=1 Tax=Actinorhabdospora filicis TaxID=1785913 RepID=A0A9W6W8Z1_9ACTN|nr:hypothetical protein Afil01_17780 [Actinorhabdospora filicis]